MSEPEKEFGPFGTTDPVDSKSRSVFSYLKYGLLLLLIPLIPLAIRGWGEIYNNFIERQFPTIEVIKPPMGLGLDPIEFKIKVADQHSGLDEIIVRSEQDGRVQDIKKQRYSEKTFEDTFTLTLAGKDLQFHEGEVRLTILAFDRSFWSNSAKVSVELQVDYQSPRIEMLSTQHNAVRGGVQLAFYRVYSDEEVFSGITVGSRIFPGFPARKLDPDFSAFSDVYFALFAVPLDFEDEHQRVTLLARDPVGNVSTASLYYRVRDLRKGEKNITLSQGFLEGAVEEIYEKYLAQEALRRGQPAKEFFPAVDQAERIERFQAINEQFRAMIEEDLKPLFGRPKAKRFWRNKFAYPGGWQAPPPFGTTKHFFFGEQKLGQVMQSGVDFGAKAGAPVRAANSGIVIFADDLGLHGKTIIIDHGFGLSTLYCHLANIEHLEGTRISSGQVIGHAGSSGFVEDTRTRFEIRLFGMPVRPAEWWDENWIEGHIEKKIYTIKKRLGMKVRKPLE